MENFNLHRGFSKKIRDPKIISAYKMKTRKREESKKQEGFYKASSLRIRFL